MTKTVHETLKAMRELLSDEKRWTQGANARTAKDSLTFVYSDAPEATCWCLAGACNKVSNYSREAQFAIRKFFGGNVEDFNDRSTHAEVLARLDDAIKATAQ